MKSFKIKFKIEKTLHLYVKGKINKKKAHFLIDTGASNSCVSTSKTTDYNIFLSKNETIAHGAGAVNMEAQISNSNTFEFGKLKIKNVNLVVFDMQHIDKAIELHHAKPIDIIIGADVLIKYKAKINYATKEISFKKLK